MRCFHVAEESCETGKELLRMPTDDKSYTNAKRISDQQERVSREPGKWLLRFFLVSHYGILNRLRSVGVMRKVLTQSGREMPDAYDKKSKNDCPSEVVKGFPEMRSDHRNKKRGEKQRDGGKNNALSLPTFLPVSFQNFIHNSIPAGLHRKISGALRMRIVRVKDGITAIRLRNELLIVIRSFLGIDQYSIGLREKREFSSCPFRTAINIGMAQPGKLPVSRFDFRLGGGLSDSQNFVVISHRALATP